MSEPLPELYEAEHCELSARLVPSTGPANTIQGEVLRAALRVTAEFNSSGCGNWPADRAFFDGIVVFLLLHLCDGTFTAETEALAKSLLNRLQVYGNCDYDLRTREEYLDLGSQISLIERLALAWCLRHPDLIPWPTPAGVSS